MENKENILIPAKVEEVAFEGDLVKKIIEKKPRSEKQMASAKQASERLAKIHALKREEKEKQKKEEEVKLVAELKEKWLKEHAEELDSKNKTTLVPKTRKPRKPLNEEQKKKLRAKPVVEEKHVSYLDEEEYSDESESDSEDDHVPKSKAKKGKKYQAEETTDAETTDTRTIKKKLEKVKQIEQVVNKQGVNPYLSLINKYWEK